MSFYIHHPAEWIGVPEHWPFTTSSGLVLETPEQWAVAVADEAAQSEELTAETRSRIIQLMVIAAERGSDVGARVFVAFESGWDSSAYIVESVIHRRSQFGGKLLESIAGLDDPAQLGPEFAEEFITESGLVGVRCYRYLSFDDQAVIYGAADYAFEGGDYVLTISGAELDLIDFEKLKLSLANLAATVEWID